MVSQSQTRQIVHNTLPQKYSTKNRAGGVVQVVKCLPSKCEALSSSTRHQKRKMETMKKATIIRKKKLYVCYQQTYTEENAKRQTESHIFMKDTDKKMEVDEI
jgi:hypothetical protein